MCFLPQEGSSLGWELGVDGGLPPRGCAFCSRLWILLGLPLWTNVRSLAKERLLEVQGTHSMPSSNAEGW